MTNELTALAAAKAYAGRGLYVFPVYGKFPPTGFKWKQHSTSSLPMVDKYAKDYPGCSWAVDCGKSNIFVVDVDVKADQGVNGFDTLKELGINMLAPYRVQTPRNGVHYYYQGEGPSTVGKMGAGLDTRGTGGYVLIPGSKTDDGTYTIIEGLIANDMPGIPIEVSQRLDHIDMEKKADRHVAVGEEDVPENIERGIQYLHTIRDVPEGERDNTCFKVAARLRDFNISPANSKQLMLDHLWENIAGDFSIEEMYAKVDSAWLNAKDKPGNATPEGRMEQMFGQFFQPLDPLQQTIPGDSSIPSSSAPRAPRIEVGEEVFKRFSAVKISELKNREWIIRGRFLKDYVTVTVAPGSSGKSLLSIAESLSIYTGEGLTHHGIVETGNTWVYNTEDPMDELERRFCAAAVFRGYRPEDMEGVIISSGYENPIKLVAMSGSDIIVNERRRDSIINTIIKNNIKLFTLDPLVEAHLVAENDNTAMAVVVQTLRFIAKMGHCAVHIIHHTTKGKALYGSADKARGASALISASRIAHTLYPMAEGDGIKWGVAPDREPWYSRMDDAKMNLTAPNKNIYWFEKQSVTVSPHLDEDTGALSIADLQSTEIDDEDEVRLIKSQAPMLIGRCETVTFRQLAYRFQGVGFMADKDFKTVERTLKKVLHDGVVIDQEIYQVSTNNRGWSTIFRASAEVDSPDPGAFDPLMGA